MLEKMDSESGVMKEVQMLNGLLPTIKREPNKAISDADLEKLFFALCGDTGKTYDSDDSIITEIDFMSAEEIAARDEAHRDTMEFIRNLPEQTKLLFKLHRIGEQTPEEREERRRVLRDYQMQHMSKEERERAEKKWLKEKEMADKRLNKEIEFFDADREKTKTSHEGTPLLTPRQFSRCLEVMVECVGKDELTADGHLDVRKTIMKIDVETLNKSLKSALLHGKFFTNGKSPAAYLKKKVVKILGYDDILDVLDGDRYGFDFDTKDQLNALCNYYLDESRENLDLTIRQFVASAYYVARRNEENFKLNDDLNYAMFG